jgi:hypothetical protein
MTRRLLVLVLFTITMVPVSDARQAGGGGGGQPGTTWTEARMREVVDVARVGRKLTPKSWPGRAKVAVCLSFDTDTEAPLLRDGTTSPTSLSAVGLWRGERHPADPRDARQVSGALNVLHDRRGRHASSRYGRGDHEKRPA